LGNWDKIQDLRSWWGEDGPGAAGLWDEEGRVVPDFDSVDFVAAVAVAAVC